MKTREEWLEAAIIELSKTVFLGEKMPEVRVSTGFTGSRNGNKAIGVCWSPLASIDNKAQLFISPIIDNSLRALDILAHELCHAIVGNEHGHKGPFAKLARKIGLEGKLTATTAGPELLKRLNEVVKLLGPYPHSALTPSKSGVKKQGTRMIKCECGECGYTVRTVNKWLDVYGAPLCPCNEQPMTIEQK